ncbi:hypothetical protein CXG81DRAFT_27919 [Caulochytrium protostelioides]|uniref:WD40 repeat-like protein n=1 Tax=Caulochytrium protostelioides TaxID=1555241 RepID=A0A4P9X0F1_9FUNG|nr:hypothetical protein CXG81DRAFT_27919 [Caulochytrium protostelioides]|eukprot:RKO99314.1 hypothetical protein CXG81DRAFT_27919 [Caulochytrium protostelioides]
MAFDPSARGVDGLTRLLALRSLGLAHTVGRPPTAYATQWQTGFRSRDHDVYRVTDAQHAPCPPLACRYATQLPHARTLAVATEDGTLALFDTAAPAGRRASPHVAWTAHQNAIFDVQWLHGDTQLVTASGDTTLRLFDVAASMAPAAGRSAPHPGPRPLAVFRGHTSSVKSIAPDPNQPHVFASSARDGTVRVWDTRLRAVGSETVCCARIAPGDGHPGEGDPAARLDRPSAAGPPPSPGAAAAAAAMGADPRPSPAPREPGHPPANRPHEADEDDDADDAVAVAAVRTHAQCIDVASAVHAPVTPGSTPATGTGSAVRPGAAASAARSPLRAYGTPARRRRTPSAGVGPAFAGAAASASAAPAGAVSGSVTAVHYLTHRERMLANIGSVDGRVHFWDLRHVGPASGAAALPVATFVPNDIHAYLAHPWGALGSSATFADSAATEAAARAASAAAAASPSSRARGFTSLTLAPDGLRLFASCTDSRIYEIRTDLARVMPIVRTAPDYACRSFYIKTAVSPGGHVLASGSSDSGIFLWDLARHGAGADSGRDAFGVLTAQSVLRAHDGEVTGVAWSPDGQQLASCADDLSIRTWRPMPAVDRGRFFYPRCTCADASAAQSPPSMAPAVWEADEGVEDAADWAVARQNLRGVAVPIVAPPEPVPAAPLMALPVAPQPPVTPTVATAPSASLRAAQPNAAPAASAPPPTLTVSPAPRLSTAGAASPDYPAPLRPPRTTPQRQQTLHAVVQLVRTPGALAPATPSRTTRLGPHCANGASPSQPRNAASAAAAGAATTATTTATAAITPTRTATPAALGATGRSDGPVRPALTLSPVSAPTTPLWATATTPLSALPSPSPRPTSQTASAFLVPSKRPRAGDAPRSPSAAPSARSPSDAAAGQENVAPRSTTASSPPLASLLARLDAYDARDVERPEKRRLLGRPVSPSPPDSAPAPLRPSRRAMGPRENLSAAAASSLSFGSLVSPASLSASLAASASTPSASPGAGTSSARPHQRTLQTYLTRPAPPALDR